MKKKKYNKNSIVRRPEGTASSLIETILNEIGWDYREWQRGLSYHFILKFEDGNVDDIFIDVYDEIGYIKLMDFCWRKVDTSDVEEVARVKEAINQFNNNENYRARVYYRVEDDVMRLSTILHCSFCKGIPNIKEYFFYQMDAVLEAHEFLFPTGGKNWSSSYDIAEDPQSKSQLDIVIDALKGLNCKPNVVCESDDSYSISFQFQTEQFWIRVMPKSEYVLLHGAIWFHCDAGNVDEFRKVTNIVNEVNWDSNMKVVYWIIDEYCFVTSHALLTCDEGIDFTHSLHLMIVSYFYTRKAFWEMLVES